METHVIQSITATDTEYSFPTFYIHRGVTGQREVTVLNCSATLSFTPVYIKPFTFDFKSAHTELYFFYLSFFPIGDFCFQFVQGRMKFIP